MNKTEKNPGAANNGACEDLAYNDDCTVGDRDSQCSTSKMSDFDIEALLDRYPAHHRLKGQVKRTEANFEILFDNHEILSHLGCNLMNDKLSWEIGYLPPWRSRTGSDPLDQSIMNRKDIGEIRSICRHFFGDRLPTNDINEYRDLFASRKEFNPVKDYLANLPAWDGKSRIERSIKAVEDTPYSRAVQRNFWLSVVQRIYEPGCQVDSMLVLVGEQGCGKTSWTRSIFPYSAAELGAIPVGSQGKDELTRCHEAPIVILDEIDKFYKKIDQSDLKAFITTRVDKWRAPYGYGDTVSPRRFVLVGTTNEFKFLQDVTGNRRYLPLVIKGKIPAENFSREWMDQCLSEALHFYKQGERFRWDQEFEQMAKAEQDVHLDDPIREQLYLYLDNPQVINKVFSPNGSLTEAVDYIDVSRVSIAYLIDSFPEFKDIDVKRDRKMVRALEAALDAHPDYERMTGRKSYRVGKKNARIAWTLVEKQEAAEERKHQEFIADEEYRISQLSDEVVNPIN